MMDTLFDMNFDNWGVFLLSLIPALVNIGIFFYVSFFLSQNKTNRSFSLFVLLAGVAQISDGLMRMSNTAETAYLWNRISFPLWVFILPVGVLFVLHFIGWYKKTNQTLLMIILFFPAAIFEFLMVVRLDDYVILKSETWNWIAHPEPTGVTNSIFLWITINSFIIFALLWFFFLKQRKNKTRNMQIFLLALGFSIPFFAGLLSEVFFPLVLDKDGIPLTTPTITFFSIAALIGITKYHLLEYSPKHHWDSIVENLNEGILIVDNADRIMYANKNFCSYTGYEFSEIEGKIAHELFFEDQDVKEKIKDALELRKKKEADQYQIQMKTKSGEKVWMLLNGSPYSDENGNVIGSIGIHTNINYLKKIEEQLRSANSELETFIYKTSHDLKAPLSSIRGLTQIATSEILDNDALKYFSMIGEMTQKLDLTLLDLVKSLAINDVKKFDDEIYFGKLIQDTLEMFRYTEGFSRIKTDVNVTVNSSFKSSKFVLESILQNLVGNSIKYQDFEKKDSFLKINISEVSGKIKIVVEDNGIGIDKIAVDKIFNMYYRATQKVKGTGLGLYLVKRGVEKLNGKIEVESELGKGTTFTLLF